MKIAGAKTTCKTSTAPTIRKGLVAQDTTSEQREQLTNKIIESTLKEHGLFWKGLTVRGVQSPQGKYRKEAWNKVDRAKKWGKENGFPHITTVEERWDVDKRFRESMEEIDMTRDDMIVFTQLSYDRPEPKPQTPDWVMGAAD